MEHTKRRLILAMLTVAAWTPAVIAQSTVTVELLGGNTFSPADVTISVGDAVQWVWVAGNHNVESGTVSAGSGVPDGNFRSGDPTPMAGTTFDLVFDQAFLDSKPMPNNVYPYYCDPHAGVGMIGTVTVQAVATCSSDADCDDADVCNGLETCTNATCSSGTALSCGDQNPCIDDSCDASLGCQNVADDANICDDGDACTENDACTAFVCSGTPIADCGNTGGGTGTSSGTCGATGMIMLASIFFGLGLMRFTGRRDRLSS